MKRKICVVTGSRADYGLLRPLLQEIKNDPALKLQLVVTGMHLSPEYGLTYKEIEKEAFHIDKKIDIFLNSDTPFGISRSVGLAVVGFADVYRDLNPDIVVLLGDRFEILAASISALINRLPIAHIHGGEVTEGVFDDAFRHAISKMSHLHFTATEIYRQRVIQLGEAPSRVFNVGAPSLDNIKRMKLLSKEKLEKALGFKFNKYNLLVTYHPVTLENDTSGEAFKNLLSAVNSLKDAHIIFTKANADTNGRIINKLIDKYVADNPNKSMAFSSMGQLRYFSYMQFVDAVVGNSSSAVAEAPSFKVATVNIGDRQTGRIKAKSIIDCPPNRQEIKKAILLVLSPKFKAGLKNVKNPYRRENTAKNIKNIIKKFLSRDLKKILKKEFYDIRVPKKGKA